MTEDEKRERRLAWQRKYALKNPDRHKKWYAPPPAQDADTGGKA
jgi:hypothetical protein